MLALQGERALAALGRAGRFGGPRAGGSGVALQTTGPTLAAGTASLGVFSPLGGVLAAQASRQAQAVAYFLLAIIV